MHFNLRYKANSAPLQSSDSDYIIYSMWRVNELISFSAASEVIHDDGDM